MTNMKQKGPEARRMRRSRLKRAMQPILTTFGCTQMQVEGHVKGMLSENVQLKTKTEELISVIKGLNAKAVEMASETNAVKDQLKATSNELEKVKQFHTDAENQLEQLRKDFKNVNEQNEKLTTALSNHMDVIVEKIDENKI